MSKGKKILIIVLAIVVIALVTIIIMKNKENEEQERINRTITTDISNEDESDEIKDKLNKVGLQVEKGDTIYSELLKENGNIYIVEGLKLEIYNMDEEKIAELSNNQENTTITIEDENGIKYNALILKNKVILNCENKQMQEKIIEAFSN